MRVVGRMSSSILIILLVTSTLAALTPVSRVAASSGLLTGRVFDKGIDKDSNGLLDFLEVKVEVNIAVSGIYYLSISGLRDTTGEPYAYVSVYDSVTVELGTAVQNVTLAFHGPTIRSSGMSGLRFVSYVYMSRQPRYYDSDSRSDLALSKAYSYTEFDTVSNAMEATFQVLPNGTIDMSGTMNTVRLANRMYGPNVNESIDVSRYGNLTAVSESGNIVLPWWLASQWPYNASAVSMLARYAKQAGTLSFGLNSTLVLPAESPYQDPQYPYSYPYMSASQYPWNTSDFNLGLTYSNGIVEGELDASTILPSAATLAFPFNVTDFSLMASCTSSLVDGSIAFHILSGFPLGDLVLGFHATRTQITGTGNVTVIYGIYPSYPEPITINETFVDALIGNVTALEGTGPYSLYNSTEGLIELDEASSITKTPLDDPPGATLGFNMILDGDWIALVAHMMSGYSTDSLTYPGVYRMLNATANSVSSATLQMSYMHDSRLAILHIDFIDNLEKLLTGLFTFPAGTTPLMVASYSMRPTLEIGDLILVKNMTDGSEINAAPYPDGDVITFHNPNNADEFIVHRAINKTLWDGTLYFQTEGDYNVGPDFWSGPDTHNGMVSERLLIGKVVERLPWIGNLVYWSCKYLFGNITQLNDLPTAITDFLSLAKTAGLRFSYASATRTFDLSASFVFDVLEYWERMAPRLPDLVDPSMKTFTTKLLANIYAEITSAEVRFAYQDGQSTYASTFTVEGDFSREINYIKQLYINQVLEYAPWSYQQPWLVINATRLEPSNLHASLRLADSSAYFNIEGLRITPPTDQANATSFRLTRFFNLTAPTSSSYPEGPVSGETLKLTVKGMDDGTHIPTLIIPSTMPAPDYMSENRTIAVWNNRSISSLKDITFSLQHYTGVQYNGQTYPVIVNSNGEVSPVAFDNINTEISLTIDGQEGTTGFANISIPKSLLNAPRDAWKIYIGSRLVVYPDYQIVETSTHTYLYVTFTYHSPVTIRVKGIDAVPELPFALVLPMFIAATLIVSLIRKKAARIRRKHDPIDE